ncbi:MAG: hypothetical protein QOD81_3405 [Solirubrobacteraceae bacterium]|jgi:hypothetical protein|nr:hypothetical protein [Solirubrobacteraceae bacterium]
MRHRLTKTLLAAAAVTALAVPAGAQAKNGADDPAGHVRHSSHQTSSSSSASHKSRSRHRGRHHSRHHSRHHARGTDDHGGQRRGRGTDDGPNHT